MLALFFLPLAHIYAMHMTSLNNAQFHATMWITCG